MAKIYKYAAILLSIFLGFSAIVFGSLLGAGIAVTVNTINTENYKNFTTALPTKLLDINGELITEFASDEKREIITIKQLPQHLIDALITREDRIFYKHHGYSFKALTRAVFGILTHSTLGGGSTLTQQIAGTLYCDRSDYSVKRKLAELWWAIQMERRYSKNEILELYLNRIYFGGGTYGVSAASKYYFGHTALEMTPAESAILVIQLSNPAMFNPFGYPERASTRQKGVLDAMVVSGYLTKSEADKSYDDYWLNFDYTRTNTSAYMMREDKAPWFSEYVRRELSDKLYGTEDIYTSGYTVNTTMNMSHQQLAQSLMTKYIKRANDLYKKEISSRQNAAIKTYIPMTDLLTLVFNLPSLKVNSRRNEKQAMSIYTSNINPILDTMSIMFGIESLKVGVVNKGTAKAQSQAQETTVEGTMISLENSTGYITALVGGSKFSASNQFIRAVQAKLQPGSTFKPLYYSAAIDSRKVTATSVISDTPVVFYTNEGKPYIPLDFRGVYEGNVQVWYALAHSMNIPSIKILDMIGFDAAINRAVALLGISEEELPSRAFVPGYPLGLGVCSVRPVEIARAFAIFANSGKEVTPIAIRNVEDRNGNIVMNPERELREEQKKKGENIQVITPQTAYIMTELLKNTVNSGTLAWGSSKASTNWSLRGSKFTYTDIAGNRYTMPAGGKTGTTQNWADAWTVGFTPYYTSVFWFGFDKPGQSLGLNITGSTLSGVVWGDYMGKINEGLPYRNFDKPDTGIVTMKVCAESGEIPTDACGNEVVTGYFLEGTEPTKTCSYHA
nr:PBP1A family penicillin-binding protein [Treponema sp.]